MRKLAWLVFYCAMIGFTVAGGVAALVSAVTLARALWAFLHGTTSAPLWEAGAALAGLAALLEGVAGVFAYLGGRAGRSLP